ncbi:hypothetical protein [Paenibacillus aquistagni]|uniref:hypothetical protein n=1 Tax=Paenibacillus aquistagni TaxID=1852522 RepID=UPI000B513963|nr:hypothetical protein [Paenibacillus aquistagni]NMM55146.1 hypothetical protein [Paenibacillus aquistagni]
MSKLLIWLGIMSISAGIVLGIYEGKEINELAKALQIADDSFHWRAAITWWVSGAISGIVFFAFSAMLEHLEELKAEIQELKSALHIPAASGTSLQTQPFHRSDRDGASVE